MKVKSVYLVKAVSRPGQQHATASAHFPAKGGYDLELNEQTGWILISKEGQSRLVPPQNICWVVPFEKDDPDLPKARPEARPAPARKGVAQEFADR